MAEVLTTLGDVIPMTDDPGCFDLTYGERIIGFGISTLCGILSGTLAVFSLFILNLRKFAVLFTCSTLLFVGGMSLLIGCKRIVRSCSDRKRLVASICLVAGMAITLFFGVVKRAIILSVAGFILEIVSYLYFVLSFIPGGERLFHLLLF